MAIRRGDNPTASTLSDMTDQPSPTKPESTNRGNPFSPAFREFIVDGWAPYSTSLPTQLPAAPWAADRRAKLRGLFPGTTLVIPAGGLQVRSNDTDYRFRAHTAFAHLSGLGADREPDAILILHASGEDVLYFRPRSPRTDQEFYASARYGEMWVGKRDSLAEMAARTGLECRAISGWLRDLDIDGKILVLPDGDPGVKNRVDLFRGEPDATGDSEFGVAVSELRFVKDTYEQDELRAACAATKVGFDAVIANLGEAVSRGRGERWVEGVFGLHARHQGNAVGYDTIAAAGDDANTLHWIRNDSDLVPGELLLLDAGVEMESLYTADVTRTLPISGRFSPAQREVYEAVYEAQQAGIAAAQPGAKFADVHRAAIEVVAKHLEAWGLLPMGVEASLAPDGGFHRRWMVHGTSHHLGMDVHDCALARTAEYRDGVLEPGMVITVEPGIYFKSTDQLVPERLRGIGVRIEDDILITPSGNENLSGAFPSRVDDVEAWVAQGQAAH